MAEMLDSSSSSFEAFLLSFNFFTILVNVYTWLAVITAAFTFRRIRSSSAAAAGSGELFSTPAEDQNNRPDLLPDSNRGSAAVVVVPTGLSAETSETATMGKFDEYYDRDDNDDDDVFVGEMIASYCRRIDGYMLKTKMGEFSWYDFQDLTVINGNIVKLWTAGDLHR